ncbi:RNA methyltransferase [Geothrix sp. PMB-07]|uniref:TrmH family RNA methyltransferase n=1 Tax=Geothrix sp. PMB-07 TaxID=3068640 RepID=UPI0027421A79|nr:RNA methyltransferase [Geothrix sp. PMB-07]WLT31283.1 RNA methyltransferase [Geothrix sp. PMB-07]
MPTLTSKANPRFKDLLVRLRPSGARRQASLLLGAKLIEAWAEVQNTSAGKRLRPAMWLRLEQMDSHPLEATLGVETLVLGEALMRELADAGSPPDHALLVEVGPEPAGALPPRILGAWGIQDPGNLGAILRSAAAFGFQEVLLGPGCTDPFHPKALRGSMGAAFLLPLRRVDALRPDDGHWYALDGGPGAVALAQADLSEPLRLWVGNEGHGWQGVDLPGEVQRLAIPIQGVESLNAAVAAGIACYEVARRTPC